MLSLSVLSIYDLLIFVLVFSLVYAILSRSKFFEKSDIPALIGLAVGLLSLASTFFVAFIIAFLPYVLGLLVFIFLALMLFSTATVPTETVSSYLKKSVLIPSLVVFMMFIFALVAYGVASSQFSSTSSSSSACISNCGSNGSGGAGSTSVRTNFNDITFSYVISILTAPQVLSLLLTLVAMAIAVYFMTRQHGA